jgi:fused signal recognition particle receptor
MSADTSEARKKPGFFTRLKEGLKRSTGALSSGITAIFTKKKLDAESLEALEEVLIRADLGTALAAEITAQVGRGRYDKEVTPAEVRAILAEELAKVLAPVEVPLAIEGAKPFVILVVGVNGSGKTTTIGKLAARFAKEGRSVVMGAGDTFRAAAIEQLKIWGARTGATVIAKPIGSDAAGVAFETMEAADAQGADVVLIDTAGRLQNKAGLMAELEKIVRVLRKKDAGLPHAVLLVLDATTGQNALNQVEVFQKVANVTGLAMTKLDGTAKGGILVAIAKRFALPVHFIGVGEAEEDLQPFEAEGFARALAGEEEEAR